MPSVTTIYPSIRAGGPTQVSGSSFSLQLGTVENGETTSATLSGQWPIYVLDLVIGKHDDMAYLAANEFTDYQSAPGWRVLPSNINAQTGATYTVADSDNGRIVTLSNDNPITVTVPTGLPIGFSAAFIQIGAGQVTFEGASGAILNTALGTAIEAQHGTALLISYAANVFNLSGALTS
jgi:hypothetical protein